MTGMTNLTSLQLLRTLADARTRYEERFGWPVTIEVQPGRLVMRLGEVADAVVMPQRLGHAVLADLRIAMLAGPVLADGGGKWWMFLTQPACHAAPKREHQLRCIEVHPVPCGARVVVPCEFDAKNGCPWIERPRALPQLPPWSAVIATARRNASIPPQRTPEHTGLRSSGVTHPPSAPVLPALA
ncbi:hypothetical protein DMH04_03200 [Kibdelosporangium aridum]|uniref:Uncharacterized protein n=2 Tax=Kibdelosporangium aridum TaxID=2030 RepID=A0A428ZR04_KIBAR|nr:hypothetical protein DMH04_03200 [Kibdelosporangium aridum]